MNVTFNVVKGGGTLDGASSITKTTGTDGIARAVLTLGSDAGINNNVVSATFEAQLADILPATYVSSGLLPGNPADTKFSGVVLDHGHTPIPNAVITIPDTTVSGTTNAEGQFLLDNVPVGHILLRIDPTGS
ncbi:MAG: carboxypeptidase-like regulatory domain-containing protein, partial [Gammaproteobacteria bacterium]|nr:carboxypeptidase-like regulatory domain-containing protein [Gammaproteobacteria bacterium]